MKSKQFVAPMFCMLLAFAGCTKDPLDDLNEEQSRIYITDYDQGAAFKSAVTFSVSDSVAVITNGRASRALTTEDKAFIGAVTLQMQSRGYRLVNKNNSPDLGINISRVYNTTTGIIDYSSYYDPYYSFYDPFYWGYGGFGYYIPYSYGTYRVTEGALSFDMLDLKNASATRKINIIWTGLVRGPGVFSENNANTEISMLFNQSPYLTNK